MSFDKVRESIGTILNKRRIAAESLFRFQNLSGENEGALTQKLPRVCILASSSRGGTAVTAELLQWQGANCSDPRGRLLTLPGEEKPHLIIAGLAFPSRVEHFDDLSEADAEACNVSVLLEEFRTEIGYPAKFCTDLELYAAQLCRRLLLQWPVFFSEVDIHEALSQLAAELRLAFPDGYEDSLKNRREALAACVRCFPFIRPDFYDCWHLHEDSDVATMAGDCWSIEETPFVFPPPWRNATNADLEQGTLLLRDPSNAWRLPFWRTVFERQKMEILHLVRDPRESIQGLCDGWNYPYGFQTMPGGFIHNIPGYAEVGIPEESRWKLSRLNFSVCKTLDRMLFSEKLNLSLVQICGVQWKDAHEIILQESRRLGLSRTIIDFSQLRWNTEITFRKICAAFGLELSESGISYSKSFNDHWVMVTPLARHNSHNRWKTSPFSQEIKKLFSSGYFDEVSKELGLDLEVSDTRKVPFVQLLNI